jgi:hypothetical protein
LLFKLILLPDIFVKEAFSEYKSVVIVEIVFNTLVFIKPLLVIKAEFNVFVTMFVFDELYDFVLSLEVGGEVGQHIDEGKYYLTKDRYHLSILGRYRYTVGGESVDVEPGTLLWFNNKLMHGTHNIGDCTRVTFVFDVPHHKSNP